MILWDFRQNVALTKCCGHEAPVSDVKFYPLVSKKRYPLLLSSGDYSVRMWHPLASSKELLKLKQHNFGAEVSFSIHILFKELFWKFDFFSSNVVVTCCDFRTCVINELLVTFSLANFQLMKCWLPSDCFIYNENVYPYEVLNQEMFFCNYHIYSHYHIHFPASSVHDTCRFKQQYLSLRNV